MSVQPASNTLKATNNKVASGSKKAKCTKPYSAATMAARRQASARYRQKNLEEEREKAREHMAKLRQQVNEDENLAEQSRARARVASHTFRQKHAANLAHRQRIIHMEYALLDLGWCCVNSVFRAYGKKHGHHAWLERYQQLETRHAEAEELAEYHRHEAEARLLLGDAYA
ncbi:hypothetical protein B0H13DRAFT_1909696 [Mycena leptocephala]|nr:hypothetical protein B0H13DRAFT_1909696 [Mycena leptocephala]